MTNGEKLKQVFPNGIVPLSNNWLNAEYKAPTPKESLVVEDEERTLALMYLEQIKNDYIEGEGYERHPLPEYYAIETAIKTLALPSVEPNADWILVSERLPEVGGEYLLWGRMIKDDDDNYCFIGEYSDSNEEFGVEIGCYDKSTLGFLGTDFDKYYSVIAWMPLPKPYEADMR